MPSGAIKILSRTYIMNIPLVDLKAQYNAIKPEIDQAIAGVIESGQFILGAEVKAFEEEIADYLGVKHAVGVASGTDALHLALLACGIGPGDEVITTPFTFIATAESISRCGATPVFADIAPGTYNIDPSQIESRISERTKAILPVYLFGQPADMEPVLKLAQKYNLKIVEDCAQALGAEYKGRKAGALGDAGCLSFFPSKNLGAYGDGGMVATNSPEVADKVGILRKHGARVSYYHSLHGFNSRLDTLQAAVLRVKLRHLDDWNKLRREKAMLYTQRLSRIAGVVPPQADGDSLSCFSYYTIRLKDSGIDRSKLRQHLESKGIQTMVYYPLSLHLQEIYKSQGYQPGDFPESESAQEQVLSLPMYPELSEDQIERVVKALAGFPR